MYKKIKHIHMIGIGGIGMSGIAELLLRNGYQVSGSDLSRGDAVKNIEALGIRVYEGHAAANVDNAELVVYSSAVNAQNPEFSAAIQKQIPVIPRAEMLAELMRLKSGIAVAGAHGKTSTTSMISIVLMEAGLDPTIVVGGRMDNFGGTNARLGSGEFIVVEADESDGSFNKLTPCIAVATNMDREHMDYYKTMRHLRKAFLSFLNKVPFYGLCVICGDDPYLAMMQHQITRRKKTYGFGADNFYQVVSYLASGTGTECRIKIGSQVETLRLQVPGKHNVLNAIAALAVADELSVPRDKALAALSSYQGVQRRFQNRGTKNGVTFFDDYAHHPVEIAATITAARERFPKVKIRVIFQPHRYSRFDDLFDQFVMCFKGCDAIAVTDIYAAGETPLPGVNSGLLAEALRKIGHQNVSYVAKPAKAVEEWLRQSAPGDIILTMGAGDLPNVYKGLF